MNKKKEELTYAPMFIPTLCRYEHFKRLIMSLQRNAYAELTELVIGLDYPPSEKYKQGWEKIRSYLPTVKGFKKLTVLETDHNLGADANWVRCENYIKNEGYDAYIASEDDNEFSPNFLDFMNKCLTYYKDDERISWVCGYSLIKANNSSIYFSRNMSAWGCATWFRKKEHMDGYMSVVFQKEVLMSFKLSWVLFKNKPSVLKGLVANVFRGVSHGDVSFELYNYLSNKYCVYPGLSLVRNWGNDGSGLHCKDNGRLYENQEIDNAPEFGFFPPEIITEERSIRKQINSSSGNTIVKNTGFRLVYIFYFLFRLDFVKMLNKFGLVVKI